jgi:hypothetical protein
MDTKLAIWSSLLPASKKDPLRKDGTVDEVMFLAQYVKPLCKSHSTPMLTPCAI